MHDSKHLRNACIHIKSFLPGAFEQLYRELGPSFGPSPFKRSKHPQIIDEKTLFASPAYMAVKAAVQARRCAGYWESPRPRGPVSVLPRVGGPEGFAPEGGAVVARREPRPVSRYQFW